MARSRIPALLSIAVILPLGFYSKLLYHGPVSDWVNNSLGGALYEIFWCLVAAFAVARWQPGPIAIGVFAATCALEFLQLWHPAILEWARSFFLGRAVLGSSFDWSDFVYYAAGSAAGYLWLKLLPGRAPRRAP